jgi:ribonuclease HI
VPKYKITVSGSFTDDVHVKECFDELSWLPDDAKVVIEPYNSAVMVYTDGGCEKAGGLGAWAFVVVDADDNPVAQNCGVEDSTTNNRMEMLAVIRALEMVEIGRSIVVTSDSQYVVKGISEWIKKWKRNGWKTFNGNGVINQDLWERMDALVQLHDVSFEHVKGHNGHKWNEICDQMCTTAMLGYDKTVA